ncbi:centromere protein O-like [Ruditapes philippinarum]|uniref:centromere protein O-like n=1 Tax=Ruditapes philippinarum TaxID=129788 RepID=UPI00295AD418|nr:centromere protein O-like [Ruditapes philippinarum]
MYRLHGVCIKSMGPDLVLRFDPLYKNQYPTTEHYSVQLLRKGENYKLGKHNLPPFIPASQLLEKYIGNGIKEFVEEVRKLLYAYIQRREGLKEAKKTYENNFHDEVEADIAVSYLKFKLWTSENFPPMEVTMQYSLEKCLPDTLEMSPAGTDEETYSMSRKTLEQRLKVMRQILLNNDIFTALSQIVQKYS